MNRTRVEIDLNSVRSDGTTRVRLSRATGPLNTGEIVTAFESEDGLAAYAMVDRVDEASGYAFITVNRDSMRDDDGSLDARTIVAGVNRASAQVANRRAAQAAGTAAKSNFAFAALSSSR